MDNVLDITAQLPALDVAAPLKLLKRLHTLGTLDNTALGIGALVISRMQESRSYRVTISRQDMVERVIVLNDEPFANLNTPEVTEIAHALYKLQAHCGLWNHTLENRVAKGKGRHGHFTEKFLLADEAQLFEALGSHTPIYFAWLPEDAENVIEEARRTIENRLRMARYSDITTTKL